MSKNRDVYVVMKYIHEHRPDCSGAACDIFLGAVTSFQTARNIIEYFVDHGDVTGENITEDDWNIISFKGKTDFWNYDISYYFKKYTIVGGD